VSSIVANMTALGLLRISRVMLIFTAQLTEEAEDNFRWLAERLDVSRTDMETSSFRISTDDEGNWEFAIIGFLVPPLA
jgi:hypothetical protein